MKVTPERARVYSQRHYYKDIERSRWLSRERVKKYATKNYYARLLRVYGLTKEQFNVLMYVQNRRCAICGNFRVGGKSFRLHIDHDHDTQKVRGLLCNNCNAMVGYAQNSVKVLISAIAYLKTKAPFDYLEDILNGL